MFILLNNVTTDAESVNHFVLSTNGPFVWLHWLHFVTLIYTQISVSIQKNLRLQFQRQL
jgi:hypothetical protein